MNLQIILRRIPPFGFRVSFNSQRIDLSTGCQVPSLKWWEEENELVKSGYVGPKGETDFAIKAESMTKFNNLLQFSLHSFVLHNLV